MKLVACTIVQFAPFFRSFVFGATDTTANALTRILQLLATHPKVQDQLREEITQALSDNGGRDLTYDELVALPLLEAVCKETLRL